MRERGTDATGKSTVRGSNFTVERGERGVMREDEGGD